MIDHTLGEGSTIRDNAVARQLLDCSSLASAIRIFGTFDTHNAFKARLQREHERKLPFGTRIA